MRAVVYSAKIRLCYFFMHTVNCIIVSIYKHTVMNGTSPRQLPVHILVLNILVILRALCERAVCVYVCMC